MDIEEGANDGLRPEQKEVLDGLVRRFFFDGERCLLVEAPTGVGKTRIALEFVREFWRRRGRCRVLVVVPRRVLAYNPWKKEIDRWMSDLEPKCLILSGFMPPKERVLALSSFQGDFLLMTAIALNNDYILGRIKLDSFDIVVFDEAHRVVAQGEELGQYRCSVHYKQLALNLTTSKGIVVLGLTIPETERTSETERHLAAIGVASETARAPKTETYAVLLGSNDAVKVDLWFRAQMWGALNNLRKVLGKKIPWKISEARLIEILEEMELPERRIRGGEEYYVVFKDTNDEWKLRVDVPEPEGPIRPVEVGQVKLPVTKVDRDTYRVSFEEVSKAPYITLPATYMKILKDGKGFRYVLGLLGEAVVAHHYELTGRKVYKLSYGLIRRKRLEGVSGEQLNFIKRLCYVVPNPPIDLVAVGNPTLLIEVKTTANDADEITVDVYGRYLEKARSLNLIPTLAVVRTWLENNNIMMSIERRMLS
jgi:hypothetical protein